MKISYIQHVEFEGLGSIEDWAIMRGHELHRINAYEPDCRWPSIEDFDLLIIMGGPMGVDDIKKYPWLSNELRFLKEANQARKRMIGICLGAQILARILNAKVYKNHEKEIGWYKVNRTNTIDSINYFPMLTSEMIVFHWHGETFDIPEKSIHLWESGACRNQAFIYENRILAFQFHFEMKPHNIKNLIKNCSDELVDSKFIQTETEILSQITNCDQNKVILYSILDEYIKIAYNN